MDIHLALRLPRNGATVPLVRHLAKQALWDINVTRDCVGDVELAVTEACANVIEHAAVDDEYLVEIDVTDTTCAIRVVDGGQGFDVRTLADSGAAAGPDGARGRGFELMRRLVDTVELRSDPEAGTVVSLTKELHFDEPPPRLRPDAATTPPAGGGRH